MTMTRTEIEAAAFWDQSVCLDCETVLTPVGGAEPTCPECGSDAVIAAETVLRCLALVGDDE